MTVSLRYPVTRFKSMKVALKELEPFIKDGAHLQSGRPFERMGGMRSREAVANWLLCAVVNEIDERELSFVSDPVDGDGVLHDAKSGDVFPTEHVMIPRQQADGKADAHQLILKAIEHKRGKGGADYASGKTLVVFLDAPVGEWFPNRVARSLPVPLLFEAVWVVGLHVAEDGAYTYNVTLLDIGAGNAPTFKVATNKTFDAWSVTTVQYSSNVETGCTAGALR